MLMAANSVNVYRLPPGRIAFALRNTAARARSLPQPAERVAMLASRGAELARKTLQMEGDYRSRHAGGGKYPAGTIRLDQRVDDGMVAVDGHLVLQARLFVGMTAGEAAERLRGSLYPEGLGAVIQLPYAAQHERVSSILDLAGSPEMADDIAAVPHLDALLAELRVRNDEYGEALDRGATRATGADVREARAECQELLAATMCQIIADYALEDGDRLDERDHLLEPILEQNEAVREIRRRRSPPTDADPDTGEEVVDEVGDDLDEDAGDDVGDELGDELDEDVDDAGDGDDAPGGEGAGDGETNADESSASVG